MHENTERFYKILESLKINQLELFVKIRKGLEFPKKQLQKI